MPTNTHTQATRLAALAVLLASSGGGDEPQQTYWPVDRIIDGDTLAIHYRSPAPVVERLRLLGVDTPERGEPGYEEAAAALARLIGRGPVRIEFDTPGKVERDRYGRLLVYLYAGGKCINVELIRQGHSRHVTKHGELRLDDLMSKAEGG